MAPVFGAFAGGLREAWQQKKLMILLYVVNLLAAYLLALPVFMLLSNALDHTTAADRLLQAFDVKIFQTLFIDIGLDVDLSKLLLTFAIFNTLIQIFFAGGILKIIIHKQAFTLKNFFIGCAKYFTRFLRLFLISLFFIGLLLSVYGLLSLVASYLTQSACTEFWPFLLLDLRLFTVAILLALINMVFDYAKIITVVNDFSGMIDTVQKTFLFVIMNLRKTTTLYALYLLSALVLLAIYWLFEGLLSISNIMGIILFIAISQIYIISRIWIRLSFFAGQNIFYRFSNIAISSMTKEMLDQDVFDSE